MKKILLLVIMLIALMVFATACAEPTLNPTEKVTQKSTATPLVTAEPTSTPGPSAASPTIQPITTPVSIFPDFVVFGDGSRTSESKVLRQYKIELTQSYLDHFVDGDNVYLLLRNVLWVFDGNTFETKQTIEVGDNALHVYVDANIIYICKSDGIYMYDNNAKELIKQTNISVTPSDFIVYEGIFYVATQKNGVNSEERITGLKPGKDDFFVDGLDMQKLCVNKEDGILYTAGSYGLHEYRLPDLEPISFIKFDNHQSVFDVFYDDSKVYTASSIYSKSNINNFLGMAEVNPDSKKGTLYANDKFILTREGVFDSNTLEFILPLNYIRFDKGFVTSAGYVFILELYSPNTIKVRNANDYLPVNETK